LKNDLKEISGLRAFKIHSHRMRLFANASTCGAVETVRRRAAH